MDLPVRAFSKKKEVNKIIFTDGYAGWGRMPKEDLRNQNVIWVVFDNREFKPCCGKVIFTSRQEIMRKNNFSSLYRGGR